MKYVKTKYITKCIIIYMTLPIASKIRMLKHCVPASTHNQQGLTGYFHML